MNRAVWRTVLSRVAMDKLLWVQSVCFALLTAWGARCSVPLPYTPVPVTLQTLFVLLSGMVLGARWGASAQVQYLLMGFIGLPVFAAGGGFWYLFNPRGTGGYLLAYPLAAYLAGRMVERMESRSLVVYLAAGVAGTAVIYVIGAAWLAVFLHLGAVQAVAMGVAPFLLGDSVKIAVAALCARGLYRLSGTLKQGDR